MPRILYSHLLTESGFDLLTESGDDLVLREIGIAGDLTASGGATGNAAGTGTVILRGSCTAHGAAGTVAGTGRIIDEVIHHVFFVPPRRRVLRGTATVAGQAGTVAGNGTVILRGTCTAHGQAGIAAGCGEVVERKLTNARWLAQLRKMDEEMLLLWA